MKDKIEAMLREMLDDATRVYRDNKEGRKHAIGDVYDATAEGFDAGRVDGIKQALEAIERIK